MAFSMVSSTDTARRSIFLYAPVRLLTFYKQTPSYLATKPPILYNYDMDHSLKRRSNAVLAINSIAHLCVDAVCACTLLGVLKDRAELALLIFLYNTLAFSTQCLVGLAADRVKRHPLFVSLAEASVAFGFLLPLPALLRVVFIGIGNSVFHVAAGAMTLEASENRAAPLGVFVAPGAIGVTLGTLYPFLGKYFALALILATCIEFALDRSFSATEIGVNADKSSLPFTRKGGVMLALFLTSAVAVRAIGGSAAAFPWKSTPLLSLLLTFFVFAGKASGGFFMDRLGARRASLISIPLAAVLTAFLSGFAVPSMIGQFALNLTMPITLYLMYRAMPDSPAFAFGLAASALWPGTAMGKLLTLTGPALWACVLISFLFGLFAILHSERRIELFDIKQNLSL